MDGIVSLFLTQLEVWKSSITVKIANYQNQITQSKKQLEESSTAAIGFMIKEEDEDKYEE